MRTSLVLTVIGDDKPGIVERLSDRILAAGANWEESRMARLGGKFTGLLRVSVETAKADALASALAALDTDGLTVVVERSGVPSPGTFRTLHLDLVGNDHPGIIRDISKVLADHDVNIEELESDITSAPMSGDPLFRAHARLRIPSTIAPAQLRRVLEALAGELMVDISLDDAQHVSAEP